MAFDTLASLVTWTQRTMILIMQDKFLFICHPKKYNDLHSLNVEKWYKIQIYIFMFVSVKYSIKSVDITLYHTLH